MEDPGLDVESKAHKEERKGLAPELREAFDKLVGAYRG